MANIFSGLFSGGGSGSSPEALARFKDRLEQQNALMEYKRRNEDLIAQTQKYDAAIQDMSPERKRQMQLFQMMAGGEETGDKGLEMMSTGFQQRGDLMQKVDSNLATNKSGLERDKAFHDWKVANPIPAGMGAKESFARFFASLPETKAEAAPGQPSQESVLQGLREEKFVDTETDFVSTRNTDNTIRKNLLQSGVTKARAPELENRLTDFYKDVDTADQNLRQIQMQRERIQGLFRITEDGNTGWNALLNIIPGSEQKEWGAVRDTILANIGLDKILDLKESSAQGATGLGALNEAELAMLQSYLGKLDQSRNAEGLKRVLMEMDGWMDTLQKKRKNTMYRRRIEYNTYKGAIGVGKDEPDLIPEWQEQVFDRTNPYVMLPADSPLRIDEETDEQKAERIRKKWNLNGTN